MIPTSILKIASVPRVTTIQATLNNTAQGRSYIPLSEVKIKLSLPDTD